MTKRIDVLRENLKKAMNEVVPDLNLDGVSQETLELMVQAKAVELQDQCQLLSFHLRELQDYNDRSNGTQSDDQTETIDVIYCIDLDTQSSWSVYKNRTANLRVLVDKHNVETGKLPDDLEYISNWRTLDISKVMSANEIVALDQWTGKPEIKVL